MVVGIWLAGQSQDPLCYVHKIAGLTGAMVADMLSDVVAAPEKLGS